MREIHWGTCVVEGPLIKKNLRYFSSQSKALITIAFVNICIIGSAERLNFDAFTFTFVLWFHVSLWPLVHWRISKATLVFLGTVICFSCAAL